ncbi:unnamed protein product [Prorocentrum cordatum]|uniref:Uncharacterized protein n=1 Tax=Prorocentrum cordatum TaxID=2364126 RepID=A0ABN9WDF4_9DINO|nr:unnamed protein product [Polarella glacialis]
MSAGGHGVRLMMRLACASRRLPRASTFSTIGWHGVKKITNRARLRAQCVASCHTAPAAQWQPRSRAGQKIRAAAWTGAQAPARRVHVCGGTARQHLRTATRQATAARRAGAETAHSQTGHHGAAEREQSQGGHGERDGTAPGRALARPVVVAGGLALPA